MAGVLDLWAWLAVLWRNQQLSLRAQLISVAGLLVSVDGLGWDSGGCLVWASVRVLQVV